MSSSEINSIDEIITSSLERDPTYDAIGLEASIGAEKFVKAYLLKNHEALGLSEEQVQVIIDNLMIEDVNEFLEAYFVDKHTKRESTEIVDKEIDDKGDIGLQLDRIRDSFYNELFVDNDEDIVGSQEFRDESFKRSLEAAIDEVMPEDRY